MCGIIGFVSPFVYLTANDFRFVLIDLVLLDYQFAYSAGGYGAAFRIEYAVNISLNRHIAIGILESKRCIEQSAVFITRLSM